MRQFYLLTGDQLTISNTKVSDKNKDIAPQIELPNGTVIPIGTVDASYTKSVYSVASKYTATFQVLDPTSIGTYSLIIVRKGAKFNERNKWTASVYINNTNTEGKVLAEHLVKAINDISVNSGLLAAQGGESNNITVQAKDSAVDYVLMGADELTYLTEKTGITVREKGKPAINDAAYIKDLADKAAADRGYEYTYQEANNLMYPNYSLNELKNLDPENKGFTVYTLKFAEKRETKTTDTAIKQIVQLAVTSDITLSTLEGSLDALGFKEYTAQ